MNELQRLIAYGDESVTARVAAFAFCVMRSDREAEVNHAIDVFKRDAGVPPDALMHCREMFRRGPGGRSPWAGVPRGKLLSLLEQLCAAVTRISPRPVGSGILLDDIPPVWKDDRSILGGYDSKQIATLAYMNAALRVVSLSSNPRPRLVIDEDKTKIPFGRRRQAHNTREFFLGEGGVPEEVVPKIARAPKPVALQLADVYAYSLAHVLDPDDQSRTDFERLLDAAQLINVPQTPLEAAPQWQAIDRPETIVDAYRTIWVLERNGRKVSVMWAAFNGGGFVAASKYQDLEDTWQHSLACETYDEAMQKTREIRAAYLADGWK